MQLNAQGTKIASCRDWGHCSRTGNKCLLSHCMSSCPLVPVVPWEGGGRLKALHMMLSLTCPAHHCHHLIDTDWVAPAADSAGRTRAFFTASAGNAQSSNHVPASLGLSNIISLTYSDDSDTIKGNKGYALPYKQYCLTQKRMHQAY